MQLRSRDTLPSFVLVESFVIIKPFKGSSNADQNWLEKSQGSPEVRSL